MADDEDQIMDVKLALLGMALWSNRRCWANTNKPIPDGERDRIAIVKLGTERTGGKFFFPRHQNFYFTRQEAFDDALKLAAGEERN